MSSCIQILQVCIEFATPPSEMGRISEEASWPRVATASGKRRRRCWVPWLFSAMLVTVAILPVQPPVAVPPAESITHTRVCCWCLRDCPLARCAPVVCRSICPSALLRRRRFWDLQQSACMQNAGFPFRSSPTNCTRTKPATDLRHERHNTQQPSNGSSSSSSSSAAAAATATSPLPFPFPLLHGCSV